MECKSLYMFYTKNRTFQCEFFKSNVTYLSNAFTHHIAYFFSQLNLVKCLQALTMVFSDLCYLLFVLTNYRVIEGKTKETKQEF